MSGASLPPESPVRDRLLECLPDATTVAWAPGRVNLIGEHTDYNGFPVLPMAIDRRVWVAASLRPRTSSLIVRNLEAERYPQEEIDLRSLESCTRRHSWVDYVVAAARDQPPRQGVELLVGGDLAAESGLASSSALVVATFLALGPTSDRFLLAERARQAERHVGTLSGGMDQAISLLATAGHASLIEFNPLRMRAIPLPSQLAVLIADSGVRAAKGGAAQASYNARGRECYAAARQLGGDSGAVLADLVTDRIEHRVGEIRDPRLRRRASFVFAEAQRVRDAVLALERGDLETLGGLISASHTGLRDDYEVSHPVVDSVVERLRDAGVLGARIVGAGFGGCAIALVRRDVLAEVMERVELPLTLVEASAAAGRFEL